MKALVTFAFCALLVSASAAFADANGLKPPRVYTGNHPPAGTKPSSFAPHPGGSKRRVYGAPIQSPIFRTPPPKSKPKSKSKPMLKSSVVPAPKQP
jgi:hypothetical protein